jgi:hypothetical protein
LQSSYNQRIKDEKMAKEKDLRSVSVEIDGASVEPASLFWKVLVKGDAPGKV